MSLSYPEAVHAVAWLIAPGRAVSYGDIAELLGAGGPRQVGAAMAGSGAASGVPWWRVVRADGSLPEPLSGEARLRWDDEGTPVRGGRIRLALARWQPSDDDFRTLDDLAAQLGGGPHAAPDPKRRGGVLG
ncbi:MGMT family protein [Zafaria sp. Z1313]|uniref:MGMT family protein n=1 Tax=unclassified Zafaria TaxID=2828765 RepID=UPI002E792BB7|nr:MGMT family protein [Zafaria sp. J156]MEE1620354.1 MGMT family protein [Zafaria sp. J156]